MSDIYDLPDGTYIVEPDGSYEDYAARWAYGYIVGIRPIEDDPEPGTLFGVWTEAGDRYFDLAVHISDYKSAVAIAKKFDQDAIWDLRNSKEIYL